MRPRWECLSCGAHTLMDECVNCGSMKLQLVRKTPGDVRTEGLPTPPGARQWQRAMLENVGHYHSIRP